MSQARNGGQGQDPARPGGGEPTPAERERRRMQVDGVAFGRALRAKRHRRGWSTHDLHDVTGLAASTINALERGQTTDPEPHVTHTLAVAFGCPDAPAMLAHERAREAGQLDVGLGARRPEVLQADARRDRGAGMTVEELAEQLLAALWRAQRRADGPRGRVVRVNLVVGSYDVEDDPEPEPAEAPDGVGGASVALPPPGASAPGGIRVVNEPEPTAPPPGPGPQEGQPG